MNAFVKWVCMMAIVIILSRTGFLVLEDSIIENKIVGGTQLHTEDMNPEQVYILDFYTSRTNIISPDKTPLSVLKTGVVTPISFFKNNELVSQNMNPFLEGYTKKLYMKAEINKNDYNEANTCKIKFEIVPSEKNDKFCLFIGGQKAIDDFLIHIYIVKTVLTSMVVLASMIALFLGVRKKDLYFLSLGIFLLLSLFYFEISIKGALAALAFIGFNVLKRKEKLICYGLVLLAILFLEINEFILIAILMVKMYDLLKKHSVEAIVSIIFLGVLYSFVSFADMGETHWLSVFYEQIYQAVFATFILVYAGYHFIIVSKKFDHNVSVDLLRGVSHDFKIPLSVIKLNTEMAAEGFSTEAKRNNIQLSTNRAIKDLERMIGSLSTYLSKSNYIDSKFNTSVKETFKKLQKNFADYDHNIAFDVIVDAEDALLPIDPIWFDRMIYNLVDNAFKYSKATGRVTLEYKKVKKKVTITVSDTGIGMTAEEISKACIPFYRADKSRSKTGLGLGLAVIKSIVEELNGNIWIKSQVNEGTNVRIEI